MGSVSRSMGILFAILMALLTGCASMPMPGTEGDYIDDTVIPNRVKAAIADELLPSCLPDWTAGAVAEIPVG